MFDFHLHSKLSFDSICEPKDIILAAERMGLREICFTDHYDFNSDKNAEHRIFTPEEYFSLYGHLTSDKLKIRRGIEYSLTEWDKSELKVVERDFDPDYIIGSVHFIDGLDPWQKEYWETRTVDEAFTDYLLGTLNCVKIHDSYDALGHINYVCKSSSNPTKEPLRYKDYSDIIDEILKEIISKGKGLEINTSGVDRVGAFLPSIDYFRRFKELGGEIVTVGSDAHTADRVGQYTGDACRLFSEIFGYVCTFEKRKPIFHKL